MDSNHPRPALGKGGESDKKEEALIAPGSGTTAKYQDSVVPQGTGTGTGEAPKPTVYPPGTCPVPALF